MLDIEMDAILAVALGGNALFGREGVQLVEKQQQHRKNSTQLDHHLEHLIKGCSHIQLDKLIQQNHMSCGGDGQPFGDALHNAEQNGLQ